jgi:mRNA interferase MazF
MKKGDIYWCSFDPPHQVIGHEQAGIRPCMIVSDELFNTSAAGLVTVLPMTTLVKKYPNRIDVGATETNGLPQDSQVLVDQIRTVCTSRLSDFIGPVEKAILTDVDEKLRFLLDL